MTTCSPQTPITEILGKHDVIISDVFDQVSILERSKSSALSTMNCLRGRHVVAHQQLKISMPGRVLHADAAQHTRARSMVVSASWSASISPRPLYRWMSSL